MKKYVTAGLIVMLLFATACQGSEEGKQDVETVAPELAAQRARESMALVDAQTSSAIGPAKDGEFLVSRCTGQDGELGDTVYYVRGSYYASVAPEPASGWIEAMGPLLSAQGLAVEMSRTADGGPHLTAEDPTNGVELVFSRTGDPGIVLLSASSACYTDPTGDPPFGPYSLPGSSGPSATS